MLLVIGDYFCHTQTERLLLNIDFITHQKKVALLIELIPHILVSIVLYKTLQYLYHKKKLLYLPIIFAITIFIALYFILLDIARYYEYHTSIKMFIVWMIAHVIYLLIVYILIRKEVGHANIQSE
ncbi:hypothetical protein ACMGE5_02420 [Macrococcus equi]|uniref:hypothetical protein n=1 Tax=Macrococcus equi TaxID=3395462 RepID=UPI0039BE5265